MNEEIDIPYGEEQTQKLTINAEKKPPSKDNMAERLPTIGVDGAKKRDEKYTGLLAQYIKNYEDNKQEIKEYRERYFNLSVLIFVILVLFGISLIVALFCIDFGIVGNIIGAITALVSIIGSMLTIPITITKHLFPQELDHEIVDIVKCMIENDCEIRRIESKTECLSCKKAQEDYSSQKK